MPSRNQLVTLGPPVLGLSARQPVADVGPDWALLLENFIPYPDRLELRPGCTNWTTGFGSPVRTLVSWEGHTSAKLFATCSTGIFDATSAGAVGGAVAALTNGYVSAVNLTTGGGSFLLIANGTDDMRMYDGTTWSAPATFGTLASADVTALEVYKQRLFLVEKESLTLWFLPVNSVAGTATSYPLGAIFRRGGALQAICTWTVDSGSGPDDHLVLISNNGELAVFAGTDPASYSTWSLKGVYYIGKPMRGSNILVKHGGDVLIVAEDGVYPLSRVLQSTTIDRKLVVTDNIQAAYTQLASLYSANLGWGIVSEPTLPLLLVNVPNSATGKQLALNTQSGAWTTFSGWKAHCFHRTGGVLYFGTDTAVAKALTGYSDFGANIVGEVLQGYTNLGYPRNKLLAGVRPTLSGTAPFNYSIGVASDFSLVPSANDIAMGASAGALWGDPGSLWGTTLWGGAETLTREWRVVPDRPGVHKAMYFGVSSNSARATLEAWDLLYRPGGTF